MYRIQLCLRFVRQSVYHCTPLSSPVPSLRPIIRRKLMLPEASEILLLPKLRNLLDLLRRQLKLSDLLILLQPLLTSTRRQRHNPLINHPPQGNLSRRNSILLCQLLVRAI